MMGGFIRMTFCAGASASPEGDVAGAGDSGAAVTGAGGVGGGGCAGAGGTSKDGSGATRMREMGGKTERLILGWPSSVFFRDSFLSISETLVVSRLGFGSAALTCAGVTRASGFFFRAFVFAGATGL